MSTRKTTLFYALLIAVSSLAVGMVISSRLDLSSESSAQSLAVPPMNSAPVTGPIDAQTFRNVAKSLTGVSGVSAFSTLVLGVIGIIMILVGSAAIRSGAMTMGDLVMYVMFTGLMAMPVVQLASIARADLARIRPSDAISSARCRAGVKRTGPADRSAKRTPKRGLTGSKAS